MGGRLFLLGLGHGPRLAARRSEDPGGGLQLAVTRELGALALVLAAFFLATFAAAGFVIVGLTYASRFFSRRDVGLIAGTGAGSWSLVVAVLMPLFGRLFDRHAYGAAFALATAVPVLGFAIWVAIQRSRGDEAISERMPAP